MKPEKRILGNFLKAPPKLTAFCSKTGAAAFLLLGLWLEEEQLGGGRGGAGRGCSTNDLVSKKLNPLVSSLQYMLIWYICVCACVSV